MPRRRRRPTRNGRAPRVRQRLGGRRCGRASRGRGRHRRRRRTSPSRAAAEQVAFDEGAGERHGEGVAGVVVLALVGVARGGSAREPAAAGRVDREGTQEVRIGGVHVLGADDAGRGRAAPGVDEGHERAGLGGGADGEEPRQRRGLAVERLLEEGAVGGVRGPGSVERTMTGMPAMRAARPGDAAGAAGAGGRRCWDWCAGGRRVVRVEDSVLGVVGSLGCSGAVDLLVGGGALVRCAESWRSGAWSVCPAPLEWASAPWSDWESALSVAWSMLGATSPGDRVGMKAVDVRARVRIGASSRPERVPLVRSRTRTTSGARDWARTASRRSARPSGSRRVTTTAITLGSTPPLSLGVGRRRGGARVIGVGRRLGARPRVTPRASSACGAPARTGHPRCRSARRWRARTRGTRRGPRTRRRPSWPRVWTRPSRGRTPPDRSGRTASAPARKAPLLGLTLVEQPVDQMSSACFPPRPSTRVLRLGCPEYMGGITRVSCHSKSSGSVILVLFFPATSGVRADSPPPALD